MKATAHRIAYGRVLLIDDDANMKRRITQELTQKVTYIPHPCCCTYRDHIRGKLMAISVMCNRYYYLAAYLFSTSYTAGRLSYQTNMLMAKVESVHPVLRPGVALIGQASQVCHTDTHEICTG